MKHELTQLRQNLRPARTAYDLLEKKRQSLLAQVQAVKIRLNKSREEAGKAIVHAYDALEEAYTDMGRDAVERVRAQLLTRNKGDTYNGKNIYNRGDTSNREESEAVRIIPYPLAGTTVSLDMAFTTWQTAKEKLAALFDAENEWYTLTQNIRKTQKRAAALGNVIIPAYEARIAYIIAQLEERERDTLARLKLVKANHTLC